MNKIYSAVGFVSIVLAGLFVGLTPETGAAQPPRVYGLYDANNVYLGDVVGAISEMTSSGIGSVFTTYLPTQEVITQIEIVDGVHASLPIPAEVFYSGADCTGNAYLSNQSGERNIIAPWSVEVDGITFKIGAASDTIATLSKKKRDGFCQEYIVGAGSQTAFPLTSITLPFDVHTIETPFELR